MQFAYSVWQESKCSKSSLYFINMHLCKVLQVHRFPATETATVMQKNKNKILNILTIFTIVSYSISLQIRKLSFLLSKVFVSRKFLEKSKSWENRIWFENYMKNFLKTNENFEILKFWKRNLFEIKIFRNFHAKKKKNFFSFRFLKRKSFEILFCWKIYAFDIFFVIWWIKTSSKLKKFV